MQLQLHGFLIPLEKSILLVLRLEYHGMKIKSNAEHIFLKATLE
jgi:hypothetical protein